MKFTRLITMLAVMASILASVPAAEGKKVKISDGKVKYTIDTTEKTASVTGYEEGVAFTKITIPDNILNTEDGKSYKVTSIAKEAFKGAFLDGISMPATIETIGSHAFETCSIYSLTLPENLKVIGAYAFCDAITPKKAIDLILPSGLMSIKGFAFNGCNIRSIRFNKKLTTLGEYCFGNTAIEEVEVPATVTSIGEGVFVGCEDLKEAVLRPAMTTIPTSLFDGCTSLESVNIPSTVTSIGKWAFAWCDALKSIDFPAGLFTIKEYAFYKSGLLKVEFPGSLQTIDEHAFSYMPALASVSIPASVTSIGGYCFDGSSQLMTVRVSNPTPCALGTCGFDSASYQKALLWVPYGSQSAYEHHREWGCFRFYYDPAQQSGVEDVEIEESKGDIYDISGIKVGTYDKDNGEDLNLPSGCYILVSGKKRIKIRL